MLYLALMMGKGIVGLEKALLKAMGWLVRRVRTRSVA